MSIIDKHLKEEINNVILAAKRQDMTIKETREAIEERFKIKLSGPIFFYMRKKLGIELQKHTHTSGRKPQGDWEAVEAILQKMNRNSAKNLYSLLCKVNSLLNEIGKPTITYMALKNFMRKNNL